GPDAHQVKFGEAGRQEENAFEVDQAGDVLLGRAVNQPVLPAAVGVVAGDALAAAEHQLLLAGRVHNEGGTIGTGAVGPVSTPTLGAGGPVEGDNVRFGVLVAIDDHEVFVKDRRTAKTVRREELARRALPDLVAVEVVTGDLDLGGLQEGDEDVLAVGGG